MLQFRIECLRYWLTTSRLIKDPLLGSELFEMRINISFISNCANNNKLFSSIRIIVVVVQSMHTEMVLDLYHYLYFFFCWKAKPCHSTQERISGTNKDIPLNSYLNVLHIVHLTYINLYRLCTWFRYQTDADLNSRF